MGDPPPVGRRGLVASGLVASLVPAAALSQSRQTVERPAPQTVSMVLPGLVEHRARLHLPAPGKPAPSIIVVPDGFGLTPEFDAMGAALAFEGIIGLVVDPVNGKLAGTGVDAERHAEEADAEVPGVISA